MSYRISTLSVLAAMLAASCYREAVDARFRDAPPVQRSDDRTPIALPSERVYATLPYMADALAFDPIVESVDPPPELPAADTNALDEVPDSTWFVNRIGLRRLAPAEAARGPDTRGAPQPPFQVAKAKSGGANPGFIMADARGVRYLVKFDTRVNPEQQTGSNVVVNRILWTLGYHVPTDLVLHFRRDQLTLPPEVSRKYGISDADIDRMLAEATRRPDGAYRVTASRFLDGVPRGGWSVTGTRADDPNDRVPHERRRVLRGLHVFAAWLGHTDIKEDNTIDMYMGEPGKGYLMHYLVDFGEALGGHQSEKDQKQVGFEYGWDWSAQGKALVAFGFWKRPWESQTRTPWRSIGYFGAEHFDPVEWRERYPYAPFHRMDRADAYWAARLVMRFDRPTLEAIVAEARFTEPGAARYLVDTLLARGRKIGAAYLDGVTPLDALSIRPGTLCAVDLSRSYGFREEGTVVAGGVAYPEAPDGRVCLPISREPGYHVLHASVRTARGHTPPIEIHYIGGTAPRVIGLVR